MKKRKTKKKKKSLLNKKIIIALIIVLTLGIIVYVKNSNPYMNNAVPKNGIYFNKTSISLAKGKTETLKVSINPSGTKIGTIKWQSSNTKVAKVDKNGKVTAVNTGTANITATANGKKITCKVTVVIPVKNIVSNTNRIVLNVGNTDKVRITISPSNATNKKVKYTSSNKKVLSIDSKGNIKALSKGSGEIIVTTEDGNKKVKIPYTVNPNKGIISGSGDVWQYKSMQTKNHLQADLSFFKKLANNGKGKIKGNIYTYNDGKYSYRYDLSQSILKVNNSDNDIWMRMYYPEDVDLSEENTLTFFGGTGEQGFGGYFSVLDKNRSDMKGSGIVILVSTKKKTKYEAEDGVLATTFIKSIVNQKKGVKNAVGGFSMGGPESGKAARLGNYDRLVICNSYFEAGNKENINALKNKEIIIFAPSKDDRTPTGETINNLVNNKYTNVTIISNYAKFVNNSRYSSKFLVINPGTQMGCCHLYANITKANLFAYATR